MSRRPGPVAAPVRSSSFEKALRRNLLCSTAIVVLAASGVDRASAQTWTGVGSTDSSAYSDSGNWSTGTVPTAADAATFDGSAYTFGVVVGGSQSLSSLTLSGVSAYMLSGGSLNVSGTITSNISNPQGAAISTDLSGTASLLAQGLTTLTGSNSYTGGTTLAAGILNAGSGNALGSTGAITLSGGTLQHSAANQTDYSSRFSTAAGQQYNIDTNGQAVTYATDLTSSGGSLTKLGTGTLTLTGANTYDGGTTLSGGSLNVGSTGALGSTGTINFAGGTLQYSSANQADYSSRFSTAANQQYSIDTNGQAVTYATNLISSGGSLTKLGTGTLTLTGTNTYDGGTTISGGGTLNLGSAGAIGSTGTISFINDGGALQYSAANQTDYSSRFSTADYQNIGIDTNGYSGTLATALTSYGTILTKLGAGTLTLTGDNTASATVLGGTLQVGNGGTAGSIANSFTTTVSSGATLAFDRSDAVTFGGYISGAGSVSQIGAGKLTLSGLNTFTGGATLGAGTLNVGSSGALGTSGVINMTGGTLQYSSANTRDYSSRFSTAANQQYNIDTNGLAVTYATALTSLGGSLTKLGAGTLKLSGANTYTGGTTLAAGTLILNNANALGTTGTINFAGGTLQYGTYITTDYSSRFATTAGQQYNINTGGYSETYAGNLTSVGGSLNLVAGDLTLSGANTFAGGTTLTAGILTLGSAGALGSTGTINMMGGALVYGANNQTDYSSRFSTAANQQYNVSTGGQAVTWATNLTSSGGSFKNNSSSGTLTLTGNNAFSGGITLAGGTTNLGSAGAFGSTGAITLSGGTLQYSAANQVDYSSRFITTTAQYNIDTNGQAVTYASNFGSAGSTLRKSGAGTLTLTGTATATSQSTISAGTLQVGNGGTTGAIVAANSVTNNAALAFDRSDAISFSNVIQGTGTLAQIGAGTLTLTGANTYTGGTTFTAGTLNAGSTGALGTAGTLSFAGGTLQYSSANQRDYSNRFSTAAAQRYSIDTNGQNVTYATALSSVGSSLTKLGTGTLTLNAANGFTTGTTVSAGTLSLQSLLTNAGIVTVASGATLDASAAGITNLAGGAIVNSGTLRDDLNNAGTFTNTGAAVANVATNTGMITNTGTWTGNVASSTGAIVNNGAWAGTINSSGNYSGTGSVAGLSLTGGSFAPGNGTAGSSSSVTGNLALTSGVQYAVQVNPSTSSSTSVGGTASLGGAAVSATFAAGSYVSRQYTIVSTQGGLTGSFGALTSTNLPGNFTASLGKDSRNAYLNLALNYTAPTATTPTTPTPTASMPVVTPVVTAPQFSGLNANQTNVARALVNSFNANGGIATSFASLTAAGLTQVSGELGTGTQQATFDAMGQFVGLMSDPTGAGRGQTAASQGAAIGYANEGTKRPPSEAMAAISRKAPLFSPQPLQRWSVWSAGFGGSQTTDGNATRGSATATSQIAGGAVGLDYLLSPNTVAGFALAGGGTSFSTANAGSGRSDLFQAGGFVRHTVGATYLTAALAYGWQDVTTERSVGADRLSARFSTDTLSGRLEAGQRLVAPVLGIGLTPYAAVQATSVSLPNYSETAGATNTFGLNYAARDVTATRSEFGLRTDKTYAVSDGVMTLRSCTAWAHNYNPDRSITATFQALPGASFVVNGAAQAREAALVTGSAEMSWLNGWNLAGTFESEFSNVTRSYAGKAVVRYGW